MKKIFYFKIKDSDQYIKKLISNKDNFILEQTKYTRKIKKEDGTSIIFNEDGFEDIYVLSLINSVRNDAKKYKFTKQEEEELIQYYKLYLDPQGYDIIKVDLSSAYWVGAIQKGLISEKTDNLFHKIYDNKKREIGKSARLKALGSLATRKSIRTYEKGKLINETVNIEATRDIYMSINREIDMLMRKAANEFDKSVYYYWDCLFIAKENSDDLVQYFKEQGYGSTKSNEIVTTVETIFNNKYLVTTDDKKYIIRKEDEWLINSKIKNKSDYEKRMEEGGWGADPTF